MVVRVGRETSARVAAKLPSAPFPNSFVMLGLSAAARFTVLPLKKESADGVGH